jgi:hypothetical protein
VATGVELLLQVPPGVEELSAIEPPTHTIDGPVIAAGGIFTVTSTVTAVLPQLLVTVYAIAAVPDVTPLTIPEVPTAAMDVLLLLHTPPVVASASVVVAPMQVVGVPVMPATDGIVITVTTLVATPPEYV